MYAGQLLIYFNLSFQDGCLQMGKYDICARNSENVQ